MRFSKMEGLGNDFVVVDGPFTPSSDDIRRMCDRRRGIGADGILVVSPLGETRVRMEYWNADGSPAEMCGNGLRCVALFAANRGYMDGTQFTVETAVGERHVELDDDSVTVELGPLSVAEELSEVAGTELRRVRVGNPHAVVQVDDPSSALVAETGSSIEKAAGVNVEFMAVHSPDLIELRVWERGVGETLACGTGAAAAVGAANAAGLIGSDATVRLPGGELEVRLRDGVAWITGPARIVFEGEWHG